MNAENRKPIDRRNKRLETSDLIQVWFPKEDAELIKQSAKLKSVPVSTFIRMVALDAARANAESVSAS